MSGTIHEMLQDRMPAVARGSTTWGAADQAHLASCAECRAEWNVIRAAVGVGVGIEREFAAAAAAQVVTARLRRERPLSRRPLLRSLVGLAAAAAIAFVFFRPTAAPVPATPAAAEARMIPELDSLNIDELTLLADAVARPLSETPLGEDPALTDLDSTQLTRVLRSLEG